MLTATSFDTVRRYSYTGGIKIKADEYDCCKYKLLYKFRSTATHQTYLVWVEAYEHNVFAIKFHLKADSQSKFKYNRLTGLGEARPIIFTCIDIMLDVYRKNPCSSFGFVGARIIAKDKEEQKNVPTKRFKVYKRVMATYFSEELFTHIFSEEKSTYIMIRKSEIEKTPDLKDRIVAEFSRLFQDFT